MAVGRFLNYELLDFEAKGCVLLISGSPGTIMLPSLYTIPSASVKALPIIS